MKAGALSAGVMIFKKSGPTVHEDNNSKLAIYRYFTDTFIDLAIFIQSILKLYRYGAALKRYFQAYQKISAELSYIDYFGD
jgi:hypothetical protein